MNHLSDANSRCRDARQRGSARLNFLIFMALLVAAVYVGYRIIPVFYQASMLKVYMQDTVNAATAANRTPEWTRQQIVSSRDDYGIPSDAAIEAAKNEQRMELHVSFTRQIPLPGYVYEYDFDHTTKSQNLF